MNADLAVERPENADIFNVMELIPSAAHPNVDHSAGSVRPYCFDASDYV
jgi:hypothetical protein